MKILKNSLLPILLLLGMAVHAQKVSNFSLANGYVITINGGSNLHDWSEKATKATATGSLTWDANNQFDITSLKLTVDVNSIKSSEGSIMNNKTYKALKNSQHPQITFVLTSPVKAVPADGKAHNINARGNLTIAGVTKPITLVLKATSSATRMDCEGKYSLKMSDYNIEQITALFGTMKVADGVTVDFKTSFSISNN